MRNAGHALALSFAALSASLALSCGGASFVLKSPVSDKCKGAGLKSCDELTDGVLAYVDGDRPGGTRKIQRVALENDGESLKKLAEALRLAAATPGLDSFKVQLGEVAGLLDSGRATSSAAATTSAEAKAPEARGQSPSATTDDSRTKTVTAILAGHPRAYACTPLGKTSQTYAGSTCLRLGIGPLVVSDVVTSAVCAGDILVMAGAPDAPAWVVSAAPPRERFSMHGARLVVAPEDELVVAVHSAAPLARDASCGVTLSTRRP